MKKRILSILLALFVMVAALPMSFGTASAAWDITLSDTAFPTYVEYKSANNFPTAANTFQSLTGEPEGWDNGITASPNDYARLESTSQPATLELSEGKAKVTATGSGSINTMIVFKSLTENDTNYIAIDIDATSLAETAYCELGINNQTQKLYALAGTEYYFVPEGSQKDIFHKDHQRKTAGTYGTPDSVWKNNFWIESGDKGTLYIPETLFGVVEGDTAGALSGGNAYKDPATSGVWNGDFSKLINATWRLSNNNRTLTSICFNFKSGSLVAQSSIIFSNVRWMSAYSYSDNYKYEYVEEDFSDADVAVSCSDAVSTMLSVEDGVWNHTLSQEAWTADTLQYSFNLDFNQPITEDFEAVRYDVDLSDIDVVPQLQIFYYVKNTDKSKNDYVRRFIVSGGWIYLVWADGSVETVEVGAREWPWFSLPQGFKGTVIIPFDVFKNLSVGNYTYDGSQTDLYKTDDVNNYGITVDMRSIDYSDNGDVITYDNFGYLTNSELPVPVADYTYSRYHISENIRTFADFEINSSVLGTWADNNTSNVSIDNNFSIENGLLKFTAPAEFNIETEATDESEATYYTKSSIGITNANLPNVTSEDQTAISFYIDCSASTKQTYLRANYFADNDNAYQPGIGGVVYLIDKDGNITSHIIETTPWSSVLLPAGFEGTVVIPFSSYATEWGWGEFINTSTVLKETQENSAKLVLYLLEATPSEVCYFGNIDYLEEYENADLVTLRKGLMKAESGEEIDVNGDTVVDLRDIVRLKKVLADAFIIN